MKGFNRLALCGAVLLAFSAQTPAPASSPGKPIRHLEYKLDVDYQTSGNVQTDAIGTTGSGIVNTGGTSGRRGKLIADVLAVGTDGGLVVRVSEWLEEQPRPDEAYTCAVYGDTRVMCPPQLNVTDAENVLLALLGRQFFDITLVDAKGAWQRTYNNPYMSVASTFTTSGALDSNPLQINEHSEIKSANGAFRNWSEDSKIGYNTTLSVPVSVHNVAIQHARGNNQTQTTVDLTLVEDSLAAH